MKRRFSFSSAIAAVAVCSVFLCFAPRSEAAYHGRRRKYLPPPLVYTAIASVNPAAMTLTTEPKNSTAHSGKLYALTSKTTVTIDGKQASLAELRPGMRVRVGAGMDANVAEEISATAPPRDVNRPGAGKKRHRR